MKTERTNKIRESLQDTLRSLGATIKAMYGLAPLAVVVGMLLTACILALTLLSTTLMMGTVIILVLVVSLGIFAARGTFGEAMLALVGGLITIFAFDWTAGRYITFISAWVGFALFALIISSIKLAAKTEDIYRQASLRLADAGSDSGAIEKELRRIGSATPLKMLGPIERAEVVLLLAFRKVPIVLFPPCLNAVETLSVITKVDFKTIAIFMADFVITFQFEAAGEASKLVDTLYDIIKDTPVPPTDFFLAFGASRRLLVSQTLMPKEFLDGLRDCLAAGVAPNEVYKELRGRFRN